MKNLQAFNPLEARLQMVLDRLSNGEPVDIKDEWIEKAAEDFKAALYKQFKPEPREFKLRASNIGRPLCQLQREQQGAESTRRDYNEILRRTFGDAIESIANVIIHASGANVTNQKVKASFDINDDQINGENDIEIDGKVYDIKSASTYAYNHKWEEGWEGLFHTDTFGYVEQLYVYANGDPNRMGGWIVIDKSSGAVKVVEANPTTEQLAVIKSRIEDREVAFRTNQPFRKCFEEEDEFFRKRPTGNKIVPKVCTFCEYQFTCWPNAKKMQHQASQAKDPQAVWYTYVVKDN